MEGYRCITLLIKEILSVLNYKSSKVFLPVLLSMSITGSITAQYPGGVSSGNLAYWLKADNGTSCTANGCSISAWSDLSGNGKTASQSVLSNQPVFQSSFYNFNPGVAFDGATGGFGDFLTSPSVLGTQTISNANVFIVSSLTGITNNFVFEETASPTRFSSHIPWGSSNVYWDVGSSTGVYRLYTPWGASVATPYLWSLLYSTTQTATTISGDKQNIIRDSEVIAFDASAATFTGLNNPFTLGESSSSTVHNPYYGTIGEIAIFFGALSAQDRQKIETYLALKYGLTLNRAGVYAQYKSSGGATVFTDTGNYWNKIAGIGKDSLSSLDQRISQSAMGSLLRVSTSTDLTSLNSSPARPALGEGQFLTWGEKLGSTNIVNQSFLGVANTRLDTIWKFNNTGTVGNVNVAIPNAVGLIANSSYMIISTDETFDNSDTLIPVVDNGSFFTATATIPNNSYVTFVSKLVPDISLLKSCVQPANCNTAPQLPNTDLKYSIAFTNGGNAAASNLIVYDSVPANTDFKLGSAIVPPNTTGLTFTIEYSNDFTSANPGAATWTYTPTSAAGGASAGYDRNVRAVRWVSSGGTLSNISPNNSGSFQFSVKIR
ncbi:MAG: hypothetical protein ACK5NT_03475 [Pyrinomonadaceae bacterium]